MTVGQLVADAEVELGLDGVDDEDVVEEFELDLVGGGFFISSNFFSRFSISWRRRAFLSSFLFHCAYLKIND